MLECLIAPLFFRHLSIEPCCVDQGDMYPLPFLYLLFLSVCCLLVGLYSRFYSHKKSPLSTASAIVVPYFINSMDRQCF